MRKAIATEEKTSERDQDASLVVRFPLPSSRSILPLAVIVSVVLWRTWAVLQWTFRADDWIYVFDARHTAFLRFIFHQYNGHLMPGEFAIAWLVSRIAPLNYGVAALPLLLLTFVSGILMWRFLNALFGDRPGNLVALALFMLCPLSLLPSFWWAASLQTIPLQLFIVATLFALLRYVRAPSRGRLLAVGLAYVGALLFWEKALLILPLAALFACFWLGEGSGRDRLRSVSLGRWPVWAVLMGVTAAYLPWYLTVAQWHSTTHLTLSALGNLAKVEVGSTIVPSFLGGPWSVTASNPWLIRELSSPLRLITLLIGAGTVGLSLVLRRQAWRAWTVLSLYLGFCVALAAHKDLAIFGAGIGLDPRFVADAVPVFALTLALAFLVPLDRRNDPAWTRRVSFRVIPAGVHRTLDPAEEGATGRGRSVRWTPRKVAVVVVLVYAVSALITGFRMANLGDGYSGKAWFDNVRTQLASHPGASVVDTGLPRNMGGFIAEANRLSYALAPIAPHIRWNAAVEQPLVFDDTGRLRPAVVAPATSAEPGPAIGCGYTIRRRAVAIPLKEHLILGLWGIEVAYSATLNTGGIVSIDDERQAVRFLAGPHALILIHAGAVSSVTVESLAPGVCVLDVRVGHVMPSG